MINLEIIKRVHRLVNEHRRDIGLKPWVFKDQPRKKWSDIIWSLSHMADGDVRYVVLPEGSTGNQLRSMIAAHRQTYLFRWKVSQEKERAKVTKVGSW